MLDSIWTWVGFNVAVVLLLILDLVVLTRKDHVIGMREAAWLTVLWTLVAAATGVFVFVASDATTGTDYITAYVAERALSIDNLFVFLVIFSYFSVPARYQARALLWGIVGALIARAVFIAAGVAIISTFSWVLYVLGAFLLYTAYKLAFAGDQEVDPSKNLALRLAKKVTTVSSEYDGHNFFTRINGVRAATPMLLVVLVLGTTDVVFAVDSIPTVFGITTNSFVVWSSNAMAVLGMRPLFFLIAGLVRLFTYLQFGLAAILGFVGAKMITEEALHAFHVTVPISKQQMTFVSLGVIVGILVLSVVASVVFKKDEDPHHLPETPAGGNPAQ